MEPLRLGRPTFAAPASSAAFFSRLSSVAKPPNWPTYTVILGASTTLTSSEVGFGARPCIDCRVVGNHGTLRCGTLLMRWRSALGQSHACI